LLLALWAVGLSRIADAGPCVAALVDRPFLTLQGQRIDSPMRITGTVKFFNVAKGFGFIQPETGGKDVFVHATALEAAGIRSLNQGDRVSFVIEDDRRGRGKQAGQLQKA
jgi:CspA family cold shock protein